MVTLKHLVVGVGIGACLGFGAGVYTGKNISQNETVKASKVVNQASLERKLTIEPSKGLIVLDPGHGYENKTSGRMDPGAVYGNYNESDIVLGQARQIKEILEKQGYDVILTRNDNKTSVPLNSRLSVAKEKKADLFVSLHCNAYESPDAKGIETFYKGRENKILAKTINDSLFNSVKSNYPNVKNREIKIANFAVLDKEFPSVLVETGFLSNKRDREYLTDNIPDVEKGIADAIHDYMSSR